MTVEECFYSIGLLASAGLTLAALLISCVQSRFGFSSNVIFCIAGLLGLRYFADKLVELRKQ
jgi:hypothetical protein